jgi:hypothetical protein
MFACGLTSWPSPVVLLREIFFLELRPRKGSFLPLVDWPGGVSTALEKLFFEFGQAPLEESTFGLLARHLQRFLI